MMRRRPFALHASLLACSVFALCTLPFAARGQTATATLSGTVEDENGAIIPGVAITAVNNGTQLTRQTTTDENGYFVIPLLSPGSYTVKAQGKGFAPVDFTEVVLNVGDQKSLQVRLKAGNISEMVKITGEAALISESPAVSTTIDRTFVGNLPLNGRSFSSLILLTPGVTINTSNLATDAGQFSVNGQRASTNYFTVDGASANFGTTINAGGAQSQYLAGAYPATNASGGTSNLVSIEALEEFKIQTSTYTAESGRQPGGQVQIVTRSGKNDFHGLLFEYFRNEALDARSYFNKPPAPQTPLRQNIYGGTFSGPVLLPNPGEGGTRLYNGRNRTFFFFSYEAARLRIPKTGQINVPSIRVRETGFPALLPLMNAFPIPTGPETTVGGSCSPGPTCAPNGRPYSGIAPHAFSRAEPSNIDTTGIRIDHTVNSKLILFGRFNEAPSNITFGVVPAFKQHSNTRTVTLGATSVASKNITNDLRFNFSRSQAKNEVFPNAIAGGVTVDDSILTNGLSGWGTVSLVSAQLSGGTANDAYQRQINIVNNLSIIAGSHNLKFGVDFRRLSPIYGAQDRQLASFSRVGLLTGVTSGLTLTTAQPSEPQFDNWSVYVQDTWKVARRLTLDLGLRWEINPPPTEKEGRMPPIALGIAGTDVSGAYLAPEGTQFYKTFWTAFAPRFGAAYQLRTKPGREMVIRGGFGVYYDLGSGTASGGWPIRISRSQTVATQQCPMIFPLSNGCVTRPGITPVTLPTSTQMTVPNENLKLPYSLEWNLAVEQSLGKQQTISVSYVASAGRRLLAQLSLNSRPWDIVNDVPLPRPNTSFGNIIYSFNGPTSDYHSMQVQYRTRLKQGLQVLANYTWSHAIDEVSTDIGDLAAGVLERGNANFDLRHNFSSAINYDIPRLRAGPVLGRMFRDWGFSAIIHANSGRPIDISGSIGEPSFFTTEDGAFLGFRPDLVAGQPLYIYDESVPGGRRFNAAAFALPPLTALGQPVRQGNFGRNVLRELPLYQVDVALGRTFKFTEALGLQLKAEAFNVFNRPQFSGYGSNLSNPNTFGVPTSTLNVGLGGLNSLYQLGGPRSIQLSARFSF